MARLLTVIADMLEKRELLCLYVSGAANRPCPACDDTKDAMARKVAEYLEGVMCQPSRYVLCGMGSRNPSPAFNYVCCVCVLLPTAQSYGRGKVYLFKTLFDDMLNCVHRLCLPRVRRSQCGTMYLFTKQLVVLSYANA
jgi:hypothetical protein